MGAVGAQLAYCARGSAGQMMTRTQRAGPRYSTAWCHASRPPPLRSSSSHRRDFPPSERPPNGSLRSPESPKGNSNGTPRTVPPGRIMGPAAAEAQVLAKTILKGLGATPGPRDAHFARTRDCFGESIPVDLEQHCTAQCDPWTCAVALQGFPGKKWADVQSRQVKQKSVGDLLLHSLTMLW